MLFLDHNARALKRVLGRIPSGCRRITNPIDFTPRTAPQPTDRVERSSTKYTCTTTSRNTRFLPASSNLRVDLVALDHRSPTSVSALWTPSCSSQTISRGRTGFFPHPYTHARSSPRLFAPSFRSLSLFRDPPFLLTSLAAGTWRVLCTGLKRSCASTAAAARSPPSTARCFFLLSSLPASARRELRGADATSGGVRSRWRAFLRASSGTRSRAVPARRSVLWV